MKMENNELSSNPTTSGQCLKTTHEHSEFLFWGKDPGLSYSAFFSYRREKLHIPALSLKQNSFLTDPNQDKAKSLKKNFVLIVKLF